MGEGYCPFKSLIEICSLSVCESSYLKQVFKCHYLFMNSFMYFKMTHFLAVVCCFCKSLFNNGFIFHLKFFLLQVFFYCQLKQ